MISGQCINVIKYLCLCICIEIFSSTEIDGTNAWILKHNIVIQSKGEVWIGIDSKRIYCSKDYYQSDYTKTCIFMRTHNYISYTHKRNSNCIIQPKDEYICLMQHKIICGL